MMQTEYKKHILLTFLLIALSSMLGCHSFNPSCAYDPRATYSDLSTFAWLPEIGYERTGIIRSQSVIAENIKASIDKVLLEKGFQKVKRDPDFYVVFHAALETKLTSYDLNHFYASPFGPKNTYWQSWSDPFAVTREYPQGTLLIDIIRRESLDLIWRGTSDANLLITSKDRFDPALTEQAIRASLEIFPPPGIDAAVEPKTPRY